MILQFAVGAGASVINIVIHALFMAVVISVVRSQAKRVSAGIWTVARVMTAVAVVLMVAHTVEALVWALTYRLTAAVDPNHSLLYFALVNFATLGYGDITPVDDWKLLGPLTAMNGIILFGWSTAVLFEVLRKTVSAMDQLDLASKKTVFPLAGDEARVGRAWSQEAIAADPVGHSDDR